MLCCYTKGRNTSGILCKDTTEVSTLRLLVVLHKHELTINLSGHFNPSSDPPASVCTGAEGKAGMAAIADPSHCTDLEKFVKDMEKALPPYARPVFLRFLPEVNKTGKMLFSLVIAFNL